MTHINTAREVLDAIYDPCSTNAGCPLSLVEMGMVTDIRDDGTSMEVMLELTEPHCMFAFRMEEEIVARLREALPGRDISVRLVFDPKNPWTEDRMDPDALQRLTDHRRKRLPLFPVEHTTA